MPQIDRFISAQDAQLHTIYNELEAGQKHTHWMRYFFPQFDGLGRSPMAQRYAIKSLKEAQEYWSHSVLRERYEKACRLLLLHRTMPIRAILGSPDDLKLHSSITLFSQVEPEHPLLRQVLEAFYEGRMDPQTLTLLAYTKSPPTGDELESLEALRKRLDLSREAAAELGKEAVSISQSGGYLSQSGHTLDLSESMQRSTSATVDIRPDAELSIPPLPAHSDGKITVANETTLAGALRLGAAHTPVLALNFANGVSPGGGFLNGARAQEEYLCRSSGLYLTLLTSQMYDFHRTRPLPDSSDWIIYSPHVPVFRSDEGELIDSPWRLSFLTCAAPYAPRIGVRESIRLMQSRTRRVIEVAVSLGYKRLVLGAWGCGAFGNDTAAVAMAFRNAIEAYAACFEHIHFAVTDWSEERRFIGPFESVFKDLSKNLQSES